MTKSDIKSSTILCHRPLECLQLLVWYFFSRQRTCLQTLPACIYVCVFVCPLFIHHEHGKRMGEWGEVCFGGGGLSRKSLNDVNEQVKWHHVLLHELHNKRIPFLSPPLCLSSPSPKWHHSPLSHLQHFCQHCFSLSPNVLISACWWIIHSLQWGLNLFDWQLHSPVCYIINIPI